MWQVYLSYGYITIELPPMTEDDAYNILETLRKYPQQGLEVGLKEVVE